MPHEVLRIFPKGRFKFSDSRIQIALFSKANAQAVSQGIVLRIQAESLPVLTQGGHNFSLIEKLIPADIQTGVVENRHSTGTQQQGMV